MSTIEVKVPDIGDFKDVEVIEVLVKAGDTIAPEQSLITVESDKASMEIPSSASGRIVELRVKVGDKVSQGSVLLVVEGPDAIGIVRTTNGATKPAEAAPGTIRADFGVTIGRNLVHASDSVESAANEVENFFGGGGIVEWDRAIDAWIIED